MWKLLSLVSTTLAFFMAIEMGRSVEPSSDADRLKESLAKWENLRDQSGGEYSYQVRWSSFLGFGHTTTVTVRGNKVVERTFEEFNRPQPVKPGAELPAKKPKWIETGKEIGTHKEGALAKTVDELYAEAKKIVDAEVPANHRRILGFNQQGILSHCFLIDSRIADDAPRNGVQPFQVQLSPKK